MAKMLVFDGATKCNVTAYDASLQANKIGKDGKSLRGYRIRVADIGKQHQEGSDHHNVKPAAK